MGGSTDGAQQPPRLAPSAPAPAAARVDAGGGTRVRGGAARSPALPGPSPGGAPRCAGPGAVQGAERSSPSPRGACSAPRSSAQAEGPEGGSPLSAKRVSSKALPLFGGVGWGWPIYRPGEEGGGAALRLPRARCPASRPPTPPAGKAANGARVTSDLRFPRSRLRGAWATGPRRFPRLAHPSP
ncbi:putative insulin-like growth factor 2 antisense gene protein [Tiliqua scincoides]|uniref:putative insulin-like growth factor 2 antisense gene protein n=1 Tax=Tiliqua scincoides TaxID=71010 RepID=UPI00346359D1